MKLTKSEKNFIRSRIYNKFWNAGSMDKNKRLEFLKSCIEKGIITENVQLTDKAITAYHNQM